MRTENIFERMIKMKKIFFIITVICMCIFCFSACVGKESPEKLLSESQELDWKIIGQAISENKAKAIEDYQGEIFNYTATVMSVEDTYCVVSELENYDSPSVNVYLEKENLVELQKGDLIKVVGTLTDIDYCEIKNAVVVETVKANENINYLINTFKDDFESAKILLNSKDNFTKLTSDEIKETIPTGWIQQKYYFSFSSGEYELVASYTGIIKLESNGTGCVQSPGNETINWFVEDNNLYMKTNTNTDKLTKSEKYKYDVCRLNDETLICFGENTVFLLINNALIK